MNKKNVVGILFFSLFAAACSSQLDLDNAASQSSLTSIKISGGKLAAGYKMHGNFNLTVESTDGDWIKTDSDGMSKAINASLAEGTPRNISVTKNKHYKFTITGNIIKEDTQSILKVKSCEKSAEPILVNQDNQTISISLCDEKEKQVSDNSDLANVVIETTYKPDTAPANMPASCRCPTGQEFLNFVKKYDLPIQGFSENLDKKDKIIASLRQEIKEEFDRPDPSAQKCHTLISKELLPAIDSEIQRLKSAKTKEKYDPDVNQMIQFSSGIKELLSTTKCSL